jgi:hypothetical protein
MPIGSIEQSWPLLAGLGCLSARRRCQRPCRLPGQGRHALLADLRQCPAHVGVLRRRADLARAAECRRQPQCPAIHRSRPWPATRRTWSGARSSQQPRPANAGNPARLSVHGHGDQGYSPTPVVEAMRGAETNLAGGEQPSEPPQGQAARMSPSSCPNINSDMQLTLFSTT